MSNLIDKDTLVAEIDRQKIGYNVDGKHSVEYDITRKIIDIVNNLEVKEENFIWNNARITVPEDSTNQIICIKEDGLAVSTVGKIVNGTIKWAYLDDLLNTNSFNVEVKEAESEEIKTPRWFLENVENTLRIQYNINLEKNGETCQDRNIKESLNGVRKLLNGKELTGMERLEKLIPYTLEVQKVDLDEEIEKCLKQHCMLAVGKKDFTDIAKHFFEIGLKVVQNNS